MKINQYLQLIAAALILLSSCKKDSEPEIGKISETITWEGKAPFKELTLNCVIPSKDDIDTLVRFINPTSPVTINFPEPPEEAFRVLPSESTNGPRSATAYLYGDYGDYYINRMHGTSSYCYLYVYSEGQNSVKGKDSGKFQGVRMNLNIDFNLKKGWNRIYITPPANESSEGLMSTLEPAGAVSWAIKANPERIWESPTQEEIVSMAKLISRVVR